MKKTYQSLVAAPLAVAAAFMTNVNQSVGQLPPLIPRQVLFGNPEKADPQVSPNGKYITYLAPDQKNVMQVWIRTIGQQGQQNDKILTSDPKRGIRRYSWTPDSKELIFQQDSDGDENWHFYAINIESKNVRDLTPFKGIKAKLVALDPNFPNEVLVGMNLRNPRQHDFYKINLKNGKAKLDTENSGSMVDAVVDHQFQIRAATATTPDGGSELLAREAINKAWKTIRKWEPNDEGEAVGFSPDGKKLYITDNHNVNATRLTSLNLVTGKETVLAQDPQYDVGEMLVHPTKREVQAVGFYKDKLEWKVLDQSIAADFAAIAKAHKGEFEVVDRDIADKTWLVKYNTDDGPIYYYTYDRPSKKGATST